MRVAARIIGSIITIAFTLSNAEGCSCFSLRPGFLSQALGGAPTRVIVRAEVVDIKGFPGPADNDLPYADVRIREVLRGTETRELIRIIGAGGSWGNCMAPVSLLRTAPEWILAIDPFASPPGEYGFWQHCSVTWAEVQGDYVVGTLRDSDYWKPRTSRMKLKKLRTLLSRSQLR